MEDKWTMEREFRDPVKELEWKTEGLPKGSAHAIAYQDKKDGTYIHFLRFEPGFGTGPEKREPMQHDFDEVVYIISGGIVNPRLNNRYKSGSVAVFPKGIKHGPGSAPVGALMIEFRHPTKTNAVSDMTQGKEFMDVMTELKWEPAVQPEGAYQAIAYRDKTSGSYVRFLRVDPGFADGYQWSEDFGKGPCCKHMEFTEIIYLISGGLYNRRLECRYQAGELAIFPPAIAHGPMEAPVGALMIEYRHFLPE